MVEQSDSRVLILLAEYSFVTGLIKYYRDVELRALAGTGLVLTAVAAAIAALEAADTPNRDAEALLLGIAAWVPALLMMIVIMAKARGLRAVLYVRDVLRELAVDYTGDDRIMAWETQAGALVNAYIRGSVAEGWSGRLAGPLMREATVAALLRGTPIIIAMMLTSIALAVGAWLVDHDWIPLVIGGPAALVCVAFAAVGLAFTRHTDVATQSGGSR